MKRVLSVGVAAALILAAPLAGSAATEELPQNADSASEKTTDTLNGTTQDSIPEVHVSGKHSVAITETFVPVGWSESIHNDTDVRAEVRIVLSGVESEGVNIVEVKDGEGNLVFSDTARDGDYTIRTLEPDETLRLSAQVELLLGDSISLNSQFTVIPQAEPETTETPVPQD